MNKARPSELLPALFKPVGDAGIKSVNASIRDA